MPSNEFYDYDAKYVNGRSRSVIPAELDPATVKQVQQQAVDAFQAVDGIGMARVDFLLDGKTRRAVRERGEHDSRLHDDQHVLADVAARAAWSTSTLLDRLIALAIERHAERQSLRTDLY